MDVLGSIRRKYLSFIPKDRSVVDPESGEVISSLDDKGREILDTTPIAPPIGFREHPSMAEVIRDMVRSERLRQEAEAAGVETFEEADDFDVGDDDDFDPSTPYENDFDPPIREIREAVEETRASRAKQNKASDDKSDTVTEAAKPPKSAEPENGDAT